MPFEPIDREPGTLLLTPAPAPAPAGVLLISAARRRRRRLDTAGGPRLCSREPSATVVCPSGVQLVYWNCGPIAPTPTRRCGWPAARLARPRLQPTQGRLVVLDGLNEASRVVRDGSTRSAGADSAAHQVAHCSLSVSGSRVVRATLSEAHLVDMPSANSIESSETSPSLVDNARRNIGSA